MRGIASNVPQFVDFEKCSSGSRIPGSQFFAPLCVELSKLFQTQSVTKGKVKYEDIFSPNIEQQKVANALFNKLIKLREDIIEEKDSQMAPSFTSVQLKMSDNLQHNVLFTQLPGNK